MGMSDVSIIPSPEVIIPNSVFMAGSALEVPFTAQGATGQTADLFQLQDVAGNVLTKMDYRGTMKENRPAYYRMFLNGVGR
jgi:hypothetical protein